MQTFLAASIPFKERKIKNVCHIMFSLHRLKVVGRELQYTNSVALFRTTLSLINKNVPQIIWG